MSKSNYIPDRVTAAEPHIVGAASLLASPTPPPVDFVVGGLPSGELGPLSGSDGSEKSMFAIQVAVACGLPIAGGAFSAPKSTGRAVYISDEDGIIYIHRRLLALRDAMAADPNPSILERYGAGLDNLNLWPLNGAHIPPLLTDRQAENRGNAQCCGRKVTGRPHC